MMSLDYQGFVKDYMVCSKHGEVGENVLQDTFDDVIMHDIATPPPEAVTNEEMGVNMQPVATNDDVFRNTLADGTEDDDGLS
jgi:hypothetical protein